MMELPVHVQLRELLLALATGLCLGLAYDLLRPLRRGRWSTALTDLIYSLLNLLALLCFSLYAGRGRLRIFAVVAVFAGLCVWLWICSPPFCAVQNRVLRILFAPARILRRGCRRLFGKFFKFCKKHIAFAEKNGKIKHDQTA